VTKFVGDVGEERAPRFQPFHYGQSLLERQVGGVWFMPKGVENEDVQALQ
jgi:hypothetical protein